MSKFQGTVRDITFRNEDNGWTVASVEIPGSGRISAVGTMPYLARGEQAIFEGELVEHRSFGEQIRVDSYELVRPETKSEIEQYLASGLIRGVGPSTARLIVQKFGVETLAVLDSHPERLREIPGIGKKKAATIAESYAEHNGMRAAMMFLQGLGLGLGMASRVYRTYENQTVEKVRSAPYDLVYDVEGVSFHIADDIARRLNVDPGSQMRLRCAMEYVLEDAAASMGHMYLPEAALIARASALLEVEPETLGPVLAQLEAGGRLVGERVDGEKAYYTRRAHRAEVETAAILRRMIARSESDARESSAPTEDEVRAEADALAAREGLELCEGQRAAAVAAVREGVCVITGGPGTGKTTAIRLILKMLDELGDVELCAPTGRAAKRMAEATGRPAQTIHRLLGYTGSRFQRDQEEPLEADAVIVDEMSMVDIHLMRALLLALRPGTRLVMVGDVDQLPSVGAGNVLRDMIESGVLPVTRLTEIFRQARQSQIIVNAHRINRGEYPEFRTRDTDFFLERRAAPAQVAESVCALVQRRLPNYLRLDPVRDIQVMAPMKKGETGVFALNAMLQAALNPGGPGVPEIRRGGTVFRRGDKVMQMNNDYELAWERDGEAGEGVFNGDIGFITALSASERALEVTFEDGRVAEYGDAQLENLEPAYCVSVHKSQGSEFEAVVLPLCHVPRMLSTRNLLYTAVTRAKRLAVIVGQEGAVRAMVDNNTIARRYTALAQRLRGAL